MSNPVKEKILEAANKLITEKGLNSFTLEEVAKEAGISKGGLLYHYSSKDALMKGLIETGIEMFEAKVSERERALSADAPSNWFISYIEEQFNTAKIDTNTMAGIIAAFALNQELLQPVLNNRKEWLEKINESKDPILGIIISLACDGIAFSNLLGIDVYPEKTKAELMERLIKLTKECY
ncbi:MAG: TetR family transcriptional regulator [Clostridiales bacterium]|jgi:AcrR family transcriptional regulator|nr:TetR family transcriptional regulator [Clostridiales bacterium]